MQRRELDRHRVGWLHRCDGARVGSHVIVGVAPSTRGFAEHVEREAVGPALLGAFHRFLDGLGEHELAGENAHRLADRRAHDRFAEPG